MKKQVFLTIDVDFTDYLSGEGCDELEMTFSGLKEYLSASSQLKTTWFIRIDDQLEKLYGTADHIFQKHAGAIDWLQSNGHQIGWHHHAYKLSERGWEQELDEEIICAALRRNGQIAQSHGLKICRTGWGYHTNKTMECLVKMDFEIDSSAIPRPVYPWELSVKDWAVTSQNAYRPSVTDYRQSGEPSLDILEIPISTMELRSPTDTQEGVMRYINPAYHHEIFKKAVEEYPHKNLVLIVHPYELIAQKSRKHPLLSFDMETLKNNLDYIQHELGTFHTLEEYQALNN